MSRVKVAERKGDAIADLRADPGVRRVGINFEPLTNPSPDATRMAVIVKRVTAA
jgi:hypothetical protein